MTTSIKIVMERLREEVEKPFINLKHLGLKLLSIQTTYSISDNRSLIILLDLHMVGWKAMETQMNGLLHIMVSENLQDIF